MVMYHERWKANATILIFLVLEAVMYSALKSNSVFITSFVMFLRYSTNGYAHGTSYKNNFVLFISDFLLSRLCHCD